MRSARHALPSLASTNPAACRQQSQPHAVASATGTPWLRDAPCLLQGACYTLPSILESLPTVMLQLFIAK